MKTAGIYGILWESMSIKMQIPAGPRSPYTAILSSDGLMNTKQTLISCSPALLTHTDAMLEHWLNSFIAPLIKHYLEQTLQGAHRS